MLEASVASELDFNNENATITSESLDEADEVDLGKVTNLTALRLQK